MEVVLHRIDEALRERERARAQQDLLMAELDHRVKNTIATIQALVRFSSRSAENLMDFTASVEDRLKAMAKAHSLLASSRWESASLRSVINEELLAERAHLEENIRLSGHDYYLEPPTALSFSLVLHELVTNALKYGSLSVPSGTLDLSWEVLEQNAAKWLCVRWVERNGPAVRPPQREGFGRMLLERVFGQGINGKVTLTFDPAGLSCVIEIPFERLVGEPSDGVPVSRPHEVLRNSSLSSLAGLKVFVVEDDVLIGMIVTDELQEAGATVIGPFIHVDDALKGVAEHDFDVALLDVNLHGIPVWPIANLIKEKGIPVVFSTGYSDRMVRPEPLAEIPIISKPYDERVLIKCLLEAVHGRLSKQ